MVRKRDIPFIFYVKQCTVTLFINPANHASGVKNGPSPGAMSSHRPTMGNIKNLLLRNHKAQSFHILCVAMYSGPLYTSCQQCPRGPYRPRPGGVMGKHKRNLILRNHKTQSFNILYVAMCSGPLYKSCQQCP